MQLAFQARLICGLLSAWLLVGAAFANGTDDVLVDQQGRQVPASSLKGQFLLVYFGFTSCPDICPTALTTVSRTLKLLGPQGAQLLPLFVTVDPQHDTVEVMRAYVAHFHPRLVGLTGTQAAVSAAQRAFNVTAHRPSPQAPIDHTLFLYLAGPDGRVLQTFHASQSAEDIAGEIRAQMSPSGANEAREKS